MHPEIDELRPKLKEILYDCAVDIKATKAALYLLDPSIRKFELVTEYGFRAAIPQSSNFNHPLVERCTRGRTPFYVNSVGADPKLSEVLFGSSSERLLVAPLFSRGDLIGLIDMRDKAGKQPFEQHDVARAQTIAEKILNVFSTKNIFNQRFVTLADVDIRSVTRSPSPVMAPVPTETATGATAIIAAARTKAAAIALAPTPRSFGEGELRAVRDVLRGMLHLPGSLVAAFTLIEPGGMLQEIAAKNTLSDDARETLQSKLQAWLAKRGETTGPLRSSVHTPFGEAGAPISAPQLEKVYTAAVNAAGYRGVYLTVAFSEAPARSTHELLAALLNQLQLAIEVSNSRDALEQTRLRVAANLIEPDFTSYPELRKHSELVAARCAAFAQYLDLSPQEVETVVLTALVHDVGMRMLDYDTLYNKRDVSANELAILKDHVLVSAAMVEPVLGHEIARAVLCHHERVDGHGYPNELRGDQIPLASRILQICDTYVTITDPHGYQRTQTHLEAMATITRGAGAQFDAVLVAKFAEMMSTS